jgi:hypothetical protein
MSIFFPDAKTSPAAYNAISDYSKATGIGNINLSDYAIKSFDADAASLLDKPFSTSPNFPDFGGNVLSSNPISTNSDAWVFITAPGSVQWNVSANVERVDIFGTNAPPVVASSRGMRDLQLTEALIEGFTLGKSVQKELDNLENLMNVEVNSESGFVSVPVYNVSAGGKSYGLYVIESIDIDEQMRDLQGRATRAMVGVSLKQVPQYQVGSGIDQAGSSTAGQALDASKFTQADKQDAKVAQNSTSTPAATAQKISGVDVPAGATNISSSTDAKGVTTVSYRVNGVTYKKKGN